MLKALAILLLAILLGAIGQVLLKSGVSQLGRSPAPLMVVRSIFTNLLVFGGFSCYAVSSLFYLVALSRLELSYAYPMIALSYVVVTVLAWRLLGESVPLLRTAGLAIILVGVAVMALSYRAVAASSPRSSIGAAASGTAPEVAHPGDR
jgi:drug/metabolite transporter (DMT)-like permease